MTGTASVFELQGGRKENEISLMTEKRSFKRERMVLVYRLLENMNQKETIVCLYLRREGEYMAYGDSDGGSKKRNHWHRSLPVGIAKKSM